METPTRRQFDLLKAIAAAWRFGRPPTTGELMAALQLPAESSLTRLLGAVERQGLVTVRGGVRGRQRLIELTSQGRAASGLGLPVLGEIPAGPLQEAIQQSGEWLDHPGALLRTQPDDFLLRVTGDSMNGAGILPGDYVLLRPHIEVRGGEIVAAQINDEGSGCVEATLKYFDRLPGGKTIRLRAANPDYPDREVAARQVSVAGVYRGLIRRGE